jgi:hypothetical protein
MGTATTTGTTTKDTIRGTAAATGTTTAAKGTAPDILDIAMGTHRIPMVVGTHQGCCCLVQGCLQAALYSTKHPSRPSRYSWLQCSR